MSDQSIQAYRDQVVQVAVRQYTYKDHDYAAVGSLASACRRCGLPFHLAVKSVNWTARPCADHLLTPQELFALDREWCAAYPICHP